MKLYIFLLFGVLFVSPCKAQSIKEWDKCCPGLHPGQMLPKSIKDIPADTVIQKFNGDTLYKIYKYECPLLKTIYGRSVKEIQVQSSVEDTILEIKIVVAYDSTLYTALKKDLGEPRVIFGWDGNEDTTAINEAVAGNYLWHLHDLSCWVQYGRSSIYLGQEIEDNIVFILSRKKVPG